MFSDDDVIMKNGGSLKSVCVITNPYHTLNDGLVN